MKEALLYAIAALVCYGVADFIYKRAAAAGLRADHFLMAQAWFFCPLVIIYALVTRRLVPDGAALWGSLAGVFIFFGFYYFSRSLATGAVSTHAAVFRLNFIVTVLLVVALLGEPLTSRKILGLALALVATWLLVGSGAADRRLNAPRGQALLHVTIATLAFGTSNFFHTVGLRHGALPETLAVAQAALFMPLATIFVYLADRKLRPPLVIFRYSIPAALVLLAATIFLLHSIAGGPASVMVPMTQMGFIVAALLGVTILGEQMTGRKAIGLASALAALAALAAS